MALQGDLASFALPDVLRLLAGTAKSGRLVVDATHHHGEVWLRDGGLAGGTVSSRPSAGDPAELIYEILQFDDGSFRFDDDDHLVDGPTSPVEDALAAAEALHAEWQAVVAVVPSLDHWVTMVPELTDGTATIDADQWKLLAAVAGGAPVRTVADRFGESDLAASQRVKAMVDAGLVGLTEPRTAPEQSWSPYRADDIILDDPLHLDDPATAADGPDDDAAEAPSDHEFVRLRAEDGPVVLESREDALLPEPLPGAGTSFSAEDESASVDTPDFDPHDVAARVGLHGDDDHGVTADLPSPFGADHHDEPAADPIPGADPLANGPARRGLDHTDAIDDVASPWTSFDSPAPATAELGTDEAAFAAVGWDQNPPVDHLSPGTGGDQDRSSLMKFLSSVKP